ncbi:D-lactate dehydrogenase [Photobacterium profundum 3TCK]|uniref:D-lactate dehydrogenase n=1 Tax=Photobacterium profundum 3TCK TaxID=314280 RepID=Q1Z0Y2_9GAMM|nr:D-lactate dehydrogenase [Photobacterium profundum 3TCK]
MKEVHGGINIMDIILMDKDYQ